MFRALALSAVLLASCVEAPEAPVPEQLGPCDYAEDPYLDSDQDGWPDCADCSPDHPRIPRLEDCPEEDPA